ncbi:hypothetical protein [Methanosarcina sp. 2.H.A.1B.4]|uniref:hypothetical protein n=1 Tax=Methanosarcina sp. 2.H.A.1B.4 TaxID=1483600 RepID=UPI00062264D3|nr:hypothetical protein [Methanosarcina sp. 2.H.A.1B.4]KKG12365.1 hypothetical protein EO92_02390 [Methanosarcina sp. 2.H.A.1B.4]
MDKIMIFDVIPDLDLVLESFLFSFFALHRLLRRRMAALFLRIIETQTGLNYEKSVTFYPQVPRYRRYFKNSLFSGKLNLCAPTFKIILRCCCELFYGIYGCIAETFRVFQKNAS